MTFTSSSDEVFNFYYAMLDELKVWELLEFRAEPQEFIVHDLRRPCLNAEASTATYTREHFTDKDVASQYIQQQAIAVALNKFMESQNAHP